MLPRCAPPGFSLRPAAQLALQVQVSYLNARGSVILSAISRCFGQYSACGLCWCRAGLHSLLGTFPASVPVQKQG